MVSKRLPPSWPPKTAHCATYYVFFDKHMAEVVSWRLFYFHDFCNTLMHNLQVSDLFPSVTSNYPRLCVAILSPTYSKYRWRCSHCNIIKIKRRFSPNGWFKNYKVTIKNKLNLIKKFVCGLIQLKILND